MALDEEDVVNCQDPCHCMARDKYHIAPSGCKKSRSSGVKELTVLIGEGETNGVSPAS